MTGLLNLMNHQNCAQLLLEQEEVLALELDVGVQEDGGRSMIVKCGANAYKMYEADCLLIKLDEMNNVGNYH